MSEASRAVIFGRDAAAYDQHRPSYPPEAITHMLGLVDARSAVEVGAGTGLATTDVARDGLRLKCLEPSTEMAGVLKARRLPGVEVVISTFEDWEAGAVSFDLIYAAQAWHWVDRSVAYPKAKALLEPSGALVLMWNIPLERYAGFEEVYLQHAPGLLAERDQRIQRRDAHPWDEDLRSFGFRDVDLFTHEWEAKMTPREYRLLHATYSDHMMLPDDVRIALLDDLEQTAQQRGDSVAVVYRTHVFSGRA